MTDNEIIKALECCVDGEKCKECPANPHRGNYGFCTPPLIQASYDLINRQRAEIERLKGILGGASEVVAKNCAIVRVEAVKEFAERLKAEKWKHKNFGELVCVEDIDNLVKEMVGEQG